MEKEQLVTGSDDDLGTAGNGLVVVLGSNNDDES